MKAVSIALPGQQRALRVAERQIQVSLFVFHAVPGEIEQQEIVSLSPVIEPRNCFADRRTTFVQECGDLIELTDVGAFRTSSSPRTSRSGAFRRPRLGSS